MNNTYKLAHPSLENPLQIDENLVNLIVIENSKLLYELLDELFIQTTGEDGGWVLSKQHREASIEKHMLLALEPFSLNLNNKKLQNKLYAILKQMSTNEDNHLLTTEMLGNISCYLANLTQHIDYPLEIEPIADVSGLFKESNLRFTSNFISLQEKLLDFMLITQELLNISIFAFFNLKSFLTSIELEELYKECFYKKIHLILFESFNNHQKLHCEVIRTIDKDLCEF